MAVSLGMFSISTILTGETASSLVAPPNPSSSSLNLRLRQAQAPANLRMVRTVPFAAVSQSSTGSGRQPRGITKPKKISPEMQALFGVPEISRTQALKQIWSYIKDNNLQDPENKKIIICDEKLKTIFAGKDQVGFLEIAGLISPHFLK